MMQFHDTFSGVLNWGIFQDKPCLLFKCSFQASVLYVLPHDLVWNGLDIQKLGC
jgi:predicted N-acyltransferase